MPLIKAVILIGGPQKGTRFRPLSLDHPKPLFPVAGIPVVQHHIEALAKVDEVKEVLLLGCYPASEMTEFVTEMNQSYNNLNVRYLQEFAPLGTAGGLYHFRDQIRSGDPDAFFVLNGDVCAEFPLREMLKFHQNAEEDVKATVLATEATKAQSLTYGCIVEDKTNHTMLHYVEKPQSYISPIINCGVYLFSLSIFELLASVFNQKQRDFYNNVSLDNIEAKEAMWLEKDILMPLAGTNQVKIYVTSNWWSQIKTAGAAIYANRHYLKLFRQTNPSRLAQVLENCNGNSGGNMNHTGKSNPEIIGDVYIHPSANIHPSAVIGPNVSIGQNVQVAAGARIKESIVLNNSNIGANSLVLYAVIGMNAKIGDWSRVEGTPNDPNPNKPFAKTDNYPLFNQEGKLNPSITIVGCQVQIPSEVILLNSVVLPNKHLSHSIKNEIVVL